MIGLIRIRPDECAGCVAEFYCFVFSVPKFVCSVKIDTPFFFVETSIVFVIRYASLVMGVFLDKFIT